MPKPRVQELPSYTIPPNVINAGFKLFGLTVFQMLVLGLAGIVGFLTLINFPVDFILFRVIGATLATCLIAGFFLAPLPALTPFEQLVSYLNYYRAQIPRQTRARPMPALPTTTAANTHSVQSLIENENENEKVS